jgi:lactoylglutathione lyase
MRAIRARGGLLLAILAILGAPAPAAIAEPASELTIHHVAMSVANVETLAAWYAEKLGFHIVKRFSLPDGREVAWLDLGSFRLGMMQVPLSVRTPEQLLHPPADLMFQGYKAIVYAVPDVDRAYRALLAMGVTGIAPPASFTPPGIRIAYISDPESNTIGLYQDLDPDNALSR